MPDTAAQDRAARLVARLGAWPIETRHTVAAILLLALATGVAWATFTQTYHLTNLYAHLGLYGDPVRPKNSISLLNRYPAGRVNDVNEKMDLFGNFALLAPLAILMPLAWTKTRLRHVTLLATVISASIEAGQWAFTPNRIAQWSDIVQNTAGATAAFLVVAPIRWLYRRRHTRTDTPTVGLTR